jgi:hypothetical protein
MTTKYYKRVDNGKYQEIGECEPELWDSVPEGVHMIVKDKNTQSRRHKVDPAWIPVLAVMMLQRDNFCNAVYKASEARPQRTLINEQERYLWEELKKVSDVNYITYPSSHDICEKSYEFIQAEVDKLLTNVAVKEAYDNFLVMCKLAYDQ